jgi:DNA replicative helicase MCM subunit Mcm2 (Cdc46/Mcm family)
MPPTPVRFTPPSQAFYLQLRADSAAPMSGGAPITARQLESLVRLAEARARVDLREEVTRADAEVGGGLQSKVSGEVVYEEPAQCRTCIRGVPSSLVCRPA